MTWENIPKYIQSQLEKNNDTYDTNLMENYFNKTVFYLLYFSVKLVVLTTSIWDADSFNKEMERIENESPTTRFLIYTYNPHNISLPKISTISFVTLENSLDPYCLLQQLRHNYFYRLGKVIISEEFINEWLDIHRQLSIECSDELKHKFISPLKETRHRPKDHYDIVRIISYISQQAYIEIQIFKKVMNIPYYVNMTKFLKSEFSKYLPSFNLDEYCAMYSFKRCEQIPYMVVKNLLLDNVYYLNKCWYDKNRNPIRILDFEMDFEYKYWEIPEKHEDIHIRHIDRHVYEEVLFLEYIYGFYNFGEFWDVLLRLMLSQRKNLPLFHLRWNRVNDIKKYLTEAGNFKYPSAYVFKEDTLFYFHRVNISLMTHGFYRGFLDPWMNSLINAKFNSHDRDEEKVYDIYLARGNFGRNLENEDYIVNTLKQKGFVILNGSEKNEVIKAYFTNARIIIGAHGSLMKNMVWCKKNPILVELCPTTRHACFYENAKECTFTPYIVLTDCDEDEKVILNTNQADNLFKLVDILQGTMI